MQKATKILPYLIIFTGFYLLFTGIYIIHSHQKFISNVITESIFMGISGAILLIIYGIILIVIFFGLKRRTWTSWYLAMIITILFLISLIFRISKLFYLDIIGIVLNVTSLYLLIRHRDSYVYPPLVKISSGGLISLGLILTSIIYGIFGSLAIGTDFSPPIKDLATAFYYTIEVMTTLGFGDILPETLVARMFTASLVVFGIASFLSAVTSFIGPVLQKRMERVVNVMENVEMANLKNHIIFCGYSPLIQGLVFELRKREIPIVIVVRDQDNYTFLRNDGFLAIRERADNPEVLIKVGIKRAKQVYLSSSDDGYNLIVALMVNKLKKEYNPNLKVSIIVTSSRNIEMVKDFVDEVIDISDILKTHLIKD